MNRLCCTLCHFLLPKIALLLNSAVSDAKFLGTTNDALAQRILQLRILA